MNNAKKEAIYFREEYSIIVTDFTERRNIYV